MENTNENKVYQVAEIQLTYTYEVKPSLRPIVSVSRDAFNILIERWDTSKIEFVEQFKVMVLNRANKVLGICDISTGGTVGTVADPKLILVTAIKANACGIVLSHNHPSGNLKPSQADIDLTKKIRDGAKLLEIQLLDHIIVTSEGYFSFADEGIL